MVQEARLYLEFAEAARPHGVAPSIHEDDFIFRFVITHPCFEKKSDAVRYYFNDGAQSCDRFCSLVSRFLPQGTASPRVLEFASGYGCVSRHLKRRTTLDVVACDIHPAAMSFISDKIGLKTLQSAHLPEAFDAHEAFDVTFALSFFSHMPHATWERWLRTLLRSVRVGGLVIFTTQGLSSTKFFGDIELNDDGYWFKAESEQHDLDTSEYGQTVVSPAYVENTLARLAGSELILFESASWWGHQDTYVVRRTS